MRARADLGLGDRAIVVANPLPPDEQLDPALHDRVPARGPRGGRGRRGAQAAT